MTEKEQAEFKERQKQAQELSAKQAVITNLLAVSKLLRELGESLGENKTELVLLFDVLDTTAQRLHEGKQLNIFNGNVSNVESLHDQITTLQAELNEAKERISAGAAVTPDAQEIINDLRKEILSLQDRNGILVEQNLYLSTGKEFVEKLNEFVNAYNTQNDRLKGIELSLLSLTEAAKVSQPEKSNG